MLPHLSTIPTLNQVGTALDKHAPKILARETHNEAAVCMLLRTGKCRGKDGLEILFIQRAEHKSDPWSGQIAFPGGRREPFDNTLVSTGQREVLEEIGINLDGSAPVNAQYLGSLDELQGRRASQKIKMIIACHVYLVDSTNHAKANDEVARIDWLCLDYLIARENQSSIQFDFNDTPYPCVILPYQGLKLWGLTYRFVENLLIKLAR